MTRTTRVALVRQWNRRDFLRTVGWGTAGMAAPALAGSESRSRPNVIVMIADDLGYSDLGCYGSEIATPHLDSLAARGLRFTQFYGCSICCPSRAALLTGLYPHQAGMGWYVNNGADSRPAGPYQGYLNDQCVTLAEVLKRSGYRTFLSGKWHVGESRPHWPVDRGFDRSFSLISGGVNYFDQTKTDWPGVTRLMAIDDRPYHPPRRGFYLTDAIADHAVGFVREAASSPDPFFLYLSFTAPHFPIQAPAPDIARNRGCYRDGWDAWRERRHRRQVGLGLLDPPAKLSPRDGKVPPWPAVADPDLEDLKMAIYAAQIQVMDRGVGRLLAELNRTGQEANTVILFLSDHGACPAEVCAQREPRFNRPPYLGGPESFAPYGRAWANLSNTPWRGFKATLGEGGLSIPMIAVWPGQRREAGGVCREVGHHIDVMPTLLEVTGATYPERWDGRVLRTLPGESLAPLLRGEAGPGPRQLFWELEGQRAVRDGDWKLTADDGQAWSLYDLVRDRGEARDLAGTHPEIVRRMAGRYEAWARDCGVRPWSEMKPMLRNLF